MSPAVLPSNAIPRPADSLHGLTAHLVRLFRCEHDWTLPYVAAFTAGGRPLAAEWSCNKCHRRRISRVI